MKIREALLLENEILEEGISSIVYHGTSITSALNILQQDRFILHPTFSKVSENNSKGKLYFLSTARTRTGRYHKDGGTPVLMRLDGRKLGQRYSGEPIDYWGPDFRAAAQGETEQEDRVYSDKPIIPRASSYMLSVDILAKDITPGKTISRNLFDLYVLLKKRRIPVRFYRNRNDWLIGSSANVMPHEEIMRFGQREEAKPVGLTPEEEEESRRYQRARTLRDLGRRKDDTLIAVYKAMKFDSKSAFTKEEEKKLYNIVREYPRNYFSPDLHNASKDRALINIMNLIAIEMRKKGIKNANELNEYIYEKWKMARW